MFVYGGHCLGKPAAARVGTLPSLEIDERSNLPSSPELLKRTLILLF
tara:strand:- start:1077 stop:1217 length:141 start_codon:yes stop_codon:yes gene_type:complete